jgi:hypothetical protein
MDCLYNDIHEREKEYRDMTGTRAGLCHSQEGKNVYYLVIFLKSCLSILTYFFFWLYACLSLAVSTGLLSHSLLHWSVFMYFYRQVA